VLSTPLSTYLPTVVDAFGRMTGDMYISNCIRMMLLCMEYNPSTIDGVVEEVDVKGKVILLGRSWQASRKNFQLTCHSRQRVGIRYLESLLLVEKERLDATELTCMREYSCILVKHPYFLHRTALAVAERYTE
jgi:hypothetical protein